MKHLLTADWHLKHKHPFSLMVNGKMWDRVCEEKLNTLNKLPAIAKKLSVDDVIIAGDIFDTSNPPEALKTEFVKIIQAFECPVYVITGRPGDHDYTSPKNFVLMDIRQAMAANDNVYIHDSNFMPLTKGVLIYHDMLEGISEFYKNVVKLSDEKFQPFQTILMGDYHAHHHVKFGKKFFIYPGPPFPTRYGENYHGVVVIDTDKEGRTTSHKYYKLKTYAFLDSTSLKVVPELAVPYVMRYSLTVPSQEIPVTLRACEDRRQSLLSGEDCDPNCMDVIWKVKTEKVLVDENGDEIEDASLKEVCLGYIEKNSGKLKKKAALLFQKLEKAVE